MVIKNIQALIFIIFQDIIVYILNDDPETKQICNLNDEDWQCGLAATGYLQKLHGDDGFKCEELGKDRYKRIIARCYIIQGDSKEDIGGLRCVGDTVTKDLLVHNQAL